MGDFLAAFLTHNRGSGEESLKYKKAFRSVLKKNLFLSPAALPKKLIATLAPSEAGLNK